MFLIIERAALEKGKIGDQSYFKRINLEKPEQSYTLLCVYSAEGRLGM